MIFDIKGRVVRFAACTSRCSGRAWGQENWRSWCLFQWWFGGQSPWSASLLLSLRDPYRHQLPYVVSQCNSYNILLGLAPHRLTMLISVTNVTVAWWQKWREAPAWRRRCYLLRPRCACQSGVLEFWRLCLRPQPRFGEWEHWRANDLVYGSSDRWQLDDNPELKRLVTTVQNDIRSNLKIAGVLHREDSKDSWHSPYRSAEPPWKIQRQLRGKILARKLDDQRDDVEFDAVHCAAPARSRRLRTVLRGLVSHARNVSATYGHRSPYTPRPRLQRWATEVVRLASAVQSSRDEQVAGRDWLYVWQSQGGSARTERWDAVTSCNLCHYGSALTVEKSSIPNLCFCLRHTWEWNGQLTMQLCNQLDS